MTCVSIAKNPKRHNPVKGSPQAFGGVLVKRLNAFNDVSHLKPGDSVIIVCRVSGHAQNHNGNLADQECNLGQIAKDLGLIVIGVIPHVGSGFDPYWLAPHIEKAKKMNAKLFAESTDRFIRSPFYHSKTNVDAQARESDLQDLRRMTENIELVTDLHPDAEPSEVRSYQRKRGQQMKDNIGGKTSILYMQKSWKTAISRVRKSLPLAG